MTTAPSTPATPRTQPDAGLDALVARLLSPGDDPAALRGDVLAALCRLGQTDAGAIVDPANQLGAAPQRTAHVPVLAVHPRPETNAAPPWIGEALALLSAVHPANGAVVRPLRAAALYGQPPTRYVIILPLRCGEDRWHVGLFLMTTSDAALAQAGAQRLTSAAGLYALLETQLATRSTLAGAHSLTAAVNVLSAVQQQTRYRAAAMALCNEVQTMWRASRVSLGVMRGHHVRLVAMSHTEHINRKTVLVQALESAMEECVDQQVEVAWPPPTDGDGAMVVARQAEALSTAHGPAWLVSVPCWVDGEVVGVLIVERAPDRPMHPPEAEALRLLCNLVAPPLEQLRANDRWLIAKAGTSVGKTAAMLVGTEHTWVKLGAVGACALLAVLIFGRGPDRVTASFLIEADARRIVAAPFDGYLETVHVEPGDAVTSGGALAALETAELRLRAAELEADRLRYVKEAGIARRKGEIAEQQASEAEAARVAAELDLVRYQIERASIVSAVAGVVLEGDHKRRIGGAVRKGDVLFEIAPLDSLQVELYVPEDRIGELHVGERGALASASHPGDFVAFTIERIEPAALVKEEQNVFRVHAALHDAPPWLRTGMEGVAKVKVGTASYLWLWTRDAIYWVRMKLWM